MQYGTTSAPRAGLGHKLISWILPLIAFFLILVAVVLAWVGVGYYYSATYNVLFLRPDSAYVGPGIGGVYIVGAILLTFALVFSFLPILGAFTTSRIFAVGPFLSLCLNCFVLLWTLTSLIVVSSYYTAYKALIRPLGDCPGIGQRYDSVQAQKCYDFFTAYTTFISGFVIGTFGLFILVLLSAYQLGTFVAPKEEAKTTYVTRTERPMTTTA